MLPAASNTLLTFRAFCGQIAIQRIQDMHVFVSVIDGSSIEIAPTGQALAQRPQWLHDFSVCGFIGTPLYSPIRAVSGQF